MAREWPLVSVVVPVYNRESYLTECVQSILQQDYPNIEVVIVDDGSTDGTGAVAKAFVSDKVKYYYQKNGGTAAALNTGIRNASGELVAWLSSDDVFLPGKLSHQVELLARYPQNAVVYTDWIKIDGEGKELGIFECPKIPSDQLLLQVIKGNFINGSTCLMRKEALYKVGLFDEHLATDSDGDMWLKLLYSGFAFLHLPIPYVKYRWHAQNMSHKFRLHAACKDEVRYRAVTSVSATDLFGAHASYPDSYLNLAFNLLQQRSLKAAFECTKRSLKGHFSVRALVILFVAIALRSDVVRKLCDRPAGTFRRLFRAMYRRA